MKKLTITLLSTSLVTGLVVTANNSYAIDFIGQEDTYIELCKSTTLSTNDQETCKEFNDYLKTKNLELENQISDTRVAVDDSKANLDEVTNELTTLKEEITSTEIEITYLETSISNLEESIEEKENEIKDRMYSMQSYMNSNYFIEFIFSASNFTDMFSRIDSVSELTSHDRDLIISLLEDKEQLESQQITIASARANLQAKHNDQEALQNQYLALYQEQNSNLIAQEKESIENSSATEEIDDNLAALAAATRESEVQGVTQATPPANPEPPVVDANEGNNNGGGNTTPTPSPGTGGGTGNFQVGVQIANAALTRQGSPYVWGATGPNSFDCSGLVIWAHQQVGINLGRPTSASLAGMGTAVAYSQLQAGDIITFRTDSSNPGRVSHVGIYIGGGQMVHASVPGTPVNVVSITSSYWQSTYHNARRLY